MPDTTYIVLRREDADGKEIGDVLAWVVVGRSDAKSTQAAIRDIATNLLEGKSGLFAAVPARSWKPVQVQSVQTTTLKLEQTDPAA
jgi:N-dimethylarginine dimethylaminohydrolase